MPASTSAYGPLLSDGFQFIERAFSDEQISQARHGQTELMAGRVDQRPAFSWPTPRTRTSRSWKSPYATHFRSELSALAQSPRLLNMIAEATGAHSIRFWFDQLLWEEPARSKAPNHFHWHTERSRWKTCHTRLMVTAWIPLTALTSEMGPITMVRNSARNQWLELPDGWQPDDFDHITSPVQPGDAALFCWHTVHGNPPNRGQAPRRAIALHYAIDELEYRKFGKFSHLNERVVAQSHNLPDFTDSRVCPVVWRSPDSSQLWKHCGRD